MRYTYFIIVFILLFAICAKAQFVEIRDTASTWFYANNEENSGDVEMMEMIYYVHKDDYEKYRDSIENGSKWWDRDELFSQYKQQINFLSMCNGELISDYDKFGIVANSKIHRFNHS